MNLNPISTVCCHMLLIFINKLIQQYFFSTYGTQSLKIPFTKGKKILKQIMFFSILPKSKRNLLSWEKKMLRIVSFIWFLEEFRKVWNSFEIYRPFSIWKSLRVLLLDLLELTILQHAYWSGLRKLLKFQISL